MTRIVFVRNSKVIDSPVVSADGFSTRPDISLNILNETPQLIMALNSEFFQDKKLLSFYI